MNMEMSPEEVKKIAVDIAASVLKISPAKVADDTRLSGAELYVFALWFVVKTGKPLIVYDPQDGMTIMEIVSVA